MFNIRQAIAVLQENLPGCTPLKVVRYNDEYVFLVKRPEIGEEDMDPFYAVGIKTGELRDFSILLHANPKEISQMFLSAPSLTDH